MFLLYCRKQLRTAFKPPERIRALLWDGLIVISKNTNNRPIECLEMLITALTDIQSSIAKEYLNDIILRNKLLNAVRNVAVCLLAYHKSENPVQGVISDLHSSLAAMSNSASFTIDLSGNSNNPSANYVDRRFGNGNKSRHNQSRPKPSHKKDTLFANERTAGQQTTPKSNDLGRCEEAPPYASLMSHYLMTKNNKAKKIAHYSSRWIMWWFIWHNNHLLMPCLMTMPFFALGDDRWRT